MMGVNCWCNIWFAKGLLKASFFGERGLDGSGFVVVGGPVHLIAQHESAGRCVWVRFRGILTFGA